MVTTEYSTAYLMSYRAHVTPVNNIVWNTFYPSLFLSCAAEQTVHLWHMDIKGNIFISSMKMTICRKFLSFFFLLVSYWLLCTMYIVCTFCLLLKLKDCAEIIIFFIFRANPELWCWISGKKNKLSISWTIVNWYLPCSFEINSIFY